MRDHDKAANSMNEEEYEKKFSELRILKSIQEYQNSDSVRKAALYPIRVPDDLLYEALRLHGPENADNLIHHIFRLGLDLWSEEFFNNAFGTKQNLEKFIALLKNRKDKGKSPTEK